jgi:hypothetical protein
MAQTISLITRQLKALSMSGVYQQGYGHSEIVARCSGYVDWVVLRTTQSVNFTGFRSWVARSAI